MSAAWRPARSVRRARHYTFLDTEILAVERPSIAHTPYSVGDPLLRRPRHQGRSTRLVTQRAGDAFAQIQARGETLDAEPSFGPSGGLYTNQGYAVVNIGGSWRPREALEVFARALNLFDRDYEEVLGYPAPGGRPTWVSALLSADNVSFRYAAGAPLVVDGVTVRLADGALAGILGPNGSGKTTLLRLLSGTRRPDRGPRAARRSPARSSCRGATVARQIAVVPQETELAFEYTGIEIVLMGRHPHLGLFDVEGPTTIASRRRRWRHRHRATSPIARVPHAERRREAARGHRRGAGAIGAPAAARRADRVARSRLPARDRVAAQDAQPGARRDDGDLDARSQPGGVDLPRADPDARRPRRFAAGPTETCSRPETCGGSTTSRPTCMSTARPGT